MNYDGPSFYKKDDSKMKSISEDENSQKNESTLTKESTESRKTPLDNSKTASQSGNHYLRSKAVLKNSQSLEGLRKAKKNKDLIVELEERLNKEKEDYLLFLEYLSDEGLVEKIEENHPDEDSADNERTIKKEKNSQKEEAILVSKEIKPNLRKPNTGLHRTLSKIIAEDEEVLKNGKKRLDSLFSDNEN